MTGRALLIGAQTFGLGGVGHDVRAMAGALEQWGFDIDRCEAEPASRAGILDACEKLIDGTGAGESIVVYFSGLGGTLRPARREDAEPPSPVRFIVPTDFGESGDATFRGITSIEFSEILHRMSDGRAVTVILDCCFDARPSRTPGMSVKALGRPAPLDPMTAHLDALRRRALPAGRRGPESVIRLYASAPGQFAYEFDGPAGARAGRFTDGLVHALREAHGVAANWSMVMDRVRRRLATLRPAQRPVATGPLERRLFGRSEGGRPVPLATTIKGERIQLWGAPLLGVQIGDEFAIMPDGPTAPGTEPIGEVVVDSLDVTWAEGRLRPRSPGAGFPGAIRAHRTRAAWIPLPLRVRVDGARGAALVDAIAASPHVRSAAPDEACAVAVGLTPDGRLVVTDRIGPLHTPQDADARGVARVMRNLTRLARATALRSLTGDPHAGLDDPQAALDEPVDVEIGLLDDHGHHTPLPESGAVAFVGQRMYARVHNRGDHAVYVSAFDVGVAGHIGLLTSGSPAGVRVDPGARCLLGGAADRGAGIGLSWPAEPDAPGVDHARPATILVVAASMPQDLDVFDRRDPPERGTLRGARSALERRFDQIVAGAPREVEGDAGPPVRYRVHAIDFELVPAALPRAERAVFQVDERPDTAARVLSAARTAPADVTVSVSNLLAHHNRSLRCGKIRLDAVVVTADRDGHPCWRVHTVRFAGIQDGVPVRPDPDSVYCGPICDQLDLAVWVACDNRGSPDLAELLARLPPDAGPPEPGGRHPLGPARATCATIDAAASIMDSCADVLGKEAGDIAGLYRVVWPAADFAGAGRPVRQNRVRARDFSFTCTVEAVRGSGGTATSPV